MPRVVNVLLSVVNEKGCLILAGVESLFVAPTPITLAMASCMAASAAPVLREATAEWNIVGKYVHLHVFGYNAPMVID